MISAYASMSLRTIALAYKNLDSWPPEKGVQADQVEFDSVFGNLTWTTVVGIQDPVRKGVQESVKICERAGVKVVMVTGDNIETARAIAKETGILKEDGIVLEGPQFRMLSEIDLEGILSKLCVIARSSPEDKRTLVKAFKARGDVVAVTGDGTNDAPALKAADVGFSMGISGTEVAKEASDIILMDDNFSSIVKALAWGRTINDAVKKFLQFQITVNITAVVLTFVSAVSSIWLPGNNGEQGSVINAVQLLWVNLIMDTFAALALATDSPTDSLLNRKPEPRKYPLITMTMWKMIWAQAILQMAVCFVLFFAAPVLPHIQDYEYRERTTLVFNVFVWMQIFNAINCRRIDNRKNILEGLWNNWFFVGILFIMIGGQVLIVFVGGSAFTVTRLDGVGWAISIIIGILALPLGYFTRMIDDRYVHWIANKIPAVPSFRRRKTSHSDKDAANLDLESSTHGQTYVPDWNHEIAERLQDDLKFFRQLRGRRLALLKQGLRNPKEAVVLAAQHGSGNRSRSGSRHSVLSAIVAPGAMAMASSIGGGKSPVDGRSIHTRTGSMSVSAPGTPNLSVSADDTAGPSSSGGPKAEV
jgi:Ca2+-transporting ATPase